MEMKRRLDDKESKADEIKEAFRDFKREILKGAENSRTSKPIPFKLIRSLATLIQIALAYAMAPGPDAATSPRAIRAPSIPTPVPYPALLAAPSRRLKRRKMRRSSACVSTTLTGETRYGSLSTRSGRRRSWRTDYT